MGWSGFWIMVGVVILAFVGEPDVQDAVIHWLGIEFDQLAH